MSLLDEIKAGREQANKFACRVCTWIEDQDSEVQQEINDWLLDENLSRKALYLLLRKNGLPVKETAFRNHAHECVLKDRDRSCR